MSAIVVNDLSINTELDGKALAEIVGGGTSIISWSWKHLSTQYYFKKLIKKQGKWYRRYAQIKLYKRTQYKCVEDYVYTVHGPYGP